MSLKFQEIVMCSQMLQGKGDCRGVFGRGQGLDDTPVKLLAHWQS